MKPIQDIRSLRSSSRNTVWSVVIAVDDRRDAGLIEQIVIEEGCEIHKADSARDIRPLLFRVKPIMLFVEKDLPELNMALLCRQVRAVNCGVILVGKFYSQRDVLIAFRMGVTDLLSQPVAPESVSSKMLDFFASAKNVRGADLNPATVREFADKALSAPEKVEKMLQATRSTTALPQAAARIVELCGNPNVAIEDLVKTALLDTGISVMLMKRANSVAFGAMARTETLRDAVVRLGFRTVRSIAMLLSVFKLTDTQDKSFAFDRLGHWIHSLGVGVIAEMLASRSGMPNPEDYFMVGVLHDFGQVLLDDNLLDDYSAVIKAAVDKNVPLFVAEHEHFGCSHAQIGERICRQWKLPETICDAIAHHHDEGPFFKESDPRTLIVDTVRLADSLARALSVGYTGDGCVFPVNESAWRRVGLHDVAPSDFAGGVVLRVREFMRGLEIASGKAGFVMPEEMTGDKWIWLASGGEPDCLLKCFLAIQGYKVYDAAATDLPSDCPPSWLIFDRRDGEPTGTADATWRETAGEIVLRGKDDNIPTDENSAAQILSAPLDCVVLLQVLRSGEN